MSECKFTPGPWRVFTNPSGSKVIGIGELTGEGVADCGFGLWHGGDNEVLANARLIAAAPELLEALKQVVSVADRKTVEFDLARAAIAKAEGRA